MTKRGKELEMRIVIDGFGGDNAPDAIALGAIEAAKEEKRTRRTK